LKDINNFQFKWGLKFFTYKKGKWKGILKKKKEKKRRERLTHLIIAYRNEFGN
jgi:hypothetical protein